MKKLSKLIAFSLVLIFSCSLSAQPLKLNYTSPMDGAVYINPEQTIIIKTGEQFRIHDNFRGNISIVGSKSGDHSFKTTLSDDNKTLIIRPNEMFIYGESVTFSLQDGLKTNNGFSISATNISFTIKPIDNLPLLVEYYQREASHTNASPSNMGSSSPREITSGGDNNLPQNYPAPEMINYEESDNGYLFYTLSPRAGAPQFSNYLSINDEYGTPLFFRETESNTLYFHAMEDGKLAYARNEQGNPEQERFFFMDSSYVVLDSVKTGNGYDMDGHDILLLDNGNYLLMSYDPQPVDMSDIVIGGNPNATVVGLIIQEVDLNGNVHFQWRSWDHFQITDATDDINLQGNYIDYVHGNAFEIDTDGNILLSSRHLDEITKIDFETGEIIYRFGKNAKNNEFTIHNDVYGFSHQHDVRLLPNGNFTIFDNGNLHQPTFSRALEYSINETAMTAELEWYYRNDPDIYGSATGSYRRDESGKHLIGWGTAWPIAATGLLPDNSKSFEVYLPTGVYSYRVISNDWNTNLFVSLPNLNLGNYSGNSIPKKMILPIHNNSDNLIRINSIHMHDSSFTLQDEVPIVISSHDTVIVTLNYLPVNQGPGSDRLTLNYDKFSLTGTERIARQVILSGIWDNSLPTVSFNPEFGEQDISPRSQLILTFSEPVKKIDGTPINNFDITNLLSLKEDSQWGDIVSFTGYISDDAMQITIEPNEDLREHQQYLLELLPSNLMDYDDNIMDYSEATYFTTSTLVDISTHNSVEEIRFYPSPMKDYLNIILPKTEIYNITMYNVSGNIIFEYTSVSNGIKIITDQLPAGLYLVNVADHKGDITSKKIIKQ